MYGNLFSGDHRQQSQYGRRTFLGGTLGAAVAAAARKPRARAARAGSSRKIKLGIVGCGGRGSMLAKMFKQHGGYEIRAVADYFQETADRCGKAVGVDASRCFSGLSGYRRVIESGIEAIALETPPCFFPDHATAAVEAGLHVYMAKPVAVDVPGCLRIEAAAEKATRKGRVFLVDYQLPTEPINIAIAERIRAGELGDVAMISTRGVSGGHPDPPKTATIESRLQKNIWDNDIPIGGDNILTFDIHCIDAAVWLFRQRPVAATGAGKIFRPDPHGDARDVCSVIFEYADGLIHEHSGQHLPNGSLGEISCRIYGLTGHAKVTYWHEAEFHIRGKKPMTGEVVDLYPNGAKRNIAAFHKCVATGSCENRIVRRAVDGCLTAILGREAYIRKARLTMDELLKEKKRIEVDLRGLKP